METLTCSLCSLGSHVVYGVGRSINRRIFAGRIGIRWRAAETNVAKSEAEKRGITLKIADGQQKQENQIKAVRSFVAQGVDAIFIAPVVATGWEPVLKEAKDAEIPVFLLDRSIDVKDKSLYMTTVTADNILEGKLIGDWLVKK